MAGGMWVAMRHRKFTAAGRIIDESLGAGSDEELSFEVLYCMRSRKE
jgi:hypothetical protein